MDIRSTWTKLIVRLESLFEELPEHRHQDQYLAARSHALALARDERTITDIARGYDGALKVQSGPKRSSVSTSPDLLLPVEVVGEELEAASLAIPIYLAEVKSGTAKLGSRDAVCSGLKSVLGSVKEIFDLTPYGKAVIEVLKEAVELYHGQ